MVNITLLTYCVFIIVVQTQALVQLKTSLASSDNPLLTKILQSIDAATSDEHLLEVTLKLLKSLCVCMRDTLKAKEDTYNSVKLLIGQSESITTEGKVLDLYKKIYNNTCFNLKEDLPKRNNITSETWSHSNCGKNHKEEKEPEHEEVLQKVKKILRSKLDHILYKALVQTRHHHKYKIRKYNLFGKAKSKVKTASKHTLIVILTLHPAKKDLRKYNVIEEDFHKVLHKNSTIEIDIIDTKYDQKEKESEEAVKPEIYSDCHLQSLYTYLAESEKKNLTKVFRFLRRRDTIKIYIEVFTGRKHTDYINICCTNGTISLSCKKDLVKNLHSEEDITVGYKNLNKNKSKTLQNDFKSTISKLKKIVKKLNYKHLNKSSINSDINVTDISSNIINKNKIKNVLLKAVPTMKENNPVADQLSLKSNSLPNLVENLSPPLKLQDVSRAIIILNDFVSKQTTVNDIKPPESNQTNNVHINPLNVISREVTFTKKVPTTTIVSHLLDKSTTITNSKTKIFQDTLTIKASEQKIDEFDNTNIIQQGKNSTELLYLLKFLKTPTSFSPLSIPQEYIINKSPASNMNQKDFSNEIITHGSSIEMMSKTINITQSKPTTENYPQESLWPSKNVRESPSNLSTVNYDVVINENGNGTTHVDDTNGLPEKSKENINMLYILPKENQTLNKEQHYNKYSDDIIEVTSTVPTLQEINLYTTNNLPTFTTFISKIQNATIPTIETLNGVLSELPILNNSIDTNHYNVYTTKTNHTNQLTSISDKKLTVINIFQKEKQIFEKEQNIDKITVQIENTTVIPTNQNTTWHIMNNSSKYTTFTLKIKDTINSTLLAFQTLPGKVADTKLTQSEEEPDLDKTLSPVKQNIVTTTPKDENDVSFVLEKDPRSLFTQKINIVTVPVEVINNTNNPMSFVNSDAKEGNEISQMKETSEAYAHSKNEDVDKTKLQTAIYSPSLYQNEDLTEKYEAYYTQAANVYSDHKTSFSNTKHNFVTKDLQNYVTPVLESTSSALLGNSNKMYTNHNGFLTEITNFVTEIKKQLPLQTYNTVTQSETLKIRHPIFINPNGSTVFNNHKSSKWFTVAKNDTITKKSPSKTWLSIDTNKVYYDEPWYTTTVENIQNHKMNSFKKVQGLLTNSKITDDKSFTANSFGQKETRDKKVHDVLNTIEASHPSDDSLVSDFKLSKNIQTDYVTVTSPNTVTSSSVLRTESVSTQDKRNNYEGLILTKSTKKMYVTAHKEVSDSPRIKSLHSSTEKRNQKGVHIFDKMKISYDSLPFQSLKEIETTNPINGSIRQVDIDVLNSTLPTSKRKDYQLDTSRIIDLSQSQLDPMRNNKVNFSINESPIFLTTNITDLQNAKPITESSIYYVLTNKTLFSTEPKMSDYSSNDTEELKKATKAPTRELIKATSTTVTDFQSVINAQYYLHDAINVTEMFESQIEQTAATYEDIPLDISNNCSRTENTELHFETNVENKISSDEPISTELGFFQNRNTNTSEDKNFREKITNNHKNQNTITIPIDLLVIQSKRPSNIKYTSQNTFFSENRIYSTTLIPSTDNTSGVQNIDHISTTATGITKNEEYIENDKVDDINTTETSDTTVKLLSNILLATKTTINGEPYDEIESTNSDATKQYDFKKTKTNRFTEDYDLPIISPKSHTTEIYLINISDYKNMQSFNNIQYTTTNPITKQTIVQTIGDYTLPEKEITLENIISINNIKTLTTNSTYLPQQIIRTISNSTIKDITKTIKNTRFTEMNTSPESRNLIESVPGRSTNKIYRNNNDKYTETKTNAALTETTVIKSNIKQTSESNVKTTLTNTDVKETLNKKFSTDLNAIQSENCIKDITRVYKMKDIKTNSIFLNDSTMEISKSLPLELNGLLHTGKGMVTTISNSINKETLTNVNLIKNTEQYSNISKKQDTTKNALPLQHFFPKNLDSTAKYIPNSKSTDSDELFQTENYDIFKTKSDNTEKKLKDTVISLNKIQDTQTNLNFLKLDLMETLKSTAIYGLPNTKNSEMDLHNSEGIESDLGLLESTNNAISPKKLNTESKENNINFVNIDKNQNMITKSVQLAQKSTKFLDSNMNYISTNIKTPNESHKFYKTENTLFDTQLKATSNEKHYSELDSTIQSDSTIQLYTAIPLDSKTTIKNEDFATYDSTNNDDNNLVKPTAAVKNLNTLLNKSTATFKQIPNDMLLTSDNARLVTLHNFKGIHSIVPEFTQYEINKRNNNTSKSTTDAVSSTIQNFTQSDIITKPILLQPISTNKMITTPKYISTTIKASMSEDTKMLEGTFDKAEENEKNINHFESIVNKSQVWNITTNETFIEKNSTEKSKIISRDTPLVTKKAMFYSLRTLRKTENSSSITTPEPITYKIIVKKSKIVAPYENTTYSNKNENKILNSITNVQNGPTEISQYEPNMLVTSNKVGFTNSHVNFGGNNSTNVQTAYDETNKKSKTPTESVTDLISLVKLNTKENYVYQYQTHNYNTSKILNMIANSIPLKQNFTKISVSTPKYISMNIEALIPEGNPAAYSTENTLFHTKLDTINMEEILTGNDNTDKYTNYFKNIANISRIPNLNTNQNTILDYITKISNSASRFPSLNIKDSVFKGLLSFRKNESLGFSTTSNLRNLKAITPKLKTTGTYGNITNNNKKSIEILDLKTNLPNGSATISQYFPNNMLMGSNNEIFTKSYNYEGIHSTIQPENSEINKKKNCTIPSVANEISSLKLYSAENNNHLINYVDTDEYQNMITNPIQFQQHNFNTTPDRKSYKRLSTKPKQKSTSNFSDKENNTTPKSKNSPIELIINENKEYDINYVNMNIDQNMNTNPMLLQKPFTEIADGTTKYSPTNIELNLTKSYDNTEITTPHTTLKTINQKFSSKYDDIEEDKKINNVNNIQSFTNKRNEAFFKNKISTTFAVMNNIKQTENRIYKAITEYKKSKASQIKTKTTSPCDNTSSYNKNIIKVPSCTANIQNQTRMHKYINNDMTVTSKNRVFKSFYDYKVTDSVIASPTHNGSNKQYNTTKPLRIYPVMLNTTEHNEYMNRNTIDPKQKNFTKMFPSTSKQIPTNIQILTLQVPYAFQKMASNVMYTKLKAQKLNNNNTFAMDKITQMPDSTSRSTTQIIKKNAFDDLPHSIGPENHRLNISPEPRIVTGIVLKSKTTAIYENSTGDNKNVINIPESTTNPSNRTTKIYQYFPSNMIITANNAVVANSYEIGRIHRTVTTHRYVETDKKNNGTIKSAAITTSSLKLNITENNEYTINEVNTKNNQNMIRNLEQFKGSNSIEMTESRNFKGLMSETEYISKPTYTTDVRDVTSTIFQSTSNCSNKISNTIPKSTKHDIGKVNITENNEDDNSIVNLKRNQNMTTNSNLLQVTPALKLKDSYKFLDINIATFTSKLKPTNEKLLSKYDDFRRVKTTANNVESFTEKQRKGFSINNLTQMFERTSGFNPLSIKYTTFVEMNHRKETENVVHNTTPELRILKPLLIKSKATTTYDNVSSENKHVIKIPDILINVQNQSTIINKYTSNNMMVSSNNSMFLSPYNFRATNSKIVSPKYKGSNNNNNTVSKSINNAKLSSLTNYNESGKNYINIYETQNMVSNPIPLQRNLTKMFESPSKYAPMNTKVSLTENPPKGKKFPSEPKSTDKDEIYMIISEPNTKEMLSQSCTTVMPNIKKKNDNITIEISETTIVSSTLQNEITVTPKYLLNNMPPTSMNKHFTIRNAFIESVKKHKDTTLNLSPTNITINIDNTGSTININQIQDVETNHNFINNNIVDTTQSITVDSRPDISNKIYEESDNIVPKQSESKNKIDELKRDVNIFNINKSRDVMYLGKNNPDILNNTVKYYFPITKETSPLLNYAEGTTTTIFDFTFKALSKKQLNKTSTANHNPTVTKKGVLEKYYNSNDRVYTISDTILNTFNIRNISREMNVTKDNVDNFKNTKVGNENSNMSSIKNNDQKNITQTSKRALNTEPLPYMEASSQGILHMEEARDEVFYITPKPTYIPSNLTTIEQISTTNYFPSESFSSWARNAVKLPNVVVNNMTLLTENAFDLNSPDRLATLPTKNKVSTINNAIVEKGMNHGDLKNAQPLTSTYMANSFLPSQLKAQNPDSIFSSNAKSDQVTQNDTKVSLDTRLSPIITVRNKLTKQHILSMKSKTTTEANHLQLQSLLLEVKQGTTLRLDKLHFNFTSYKLQENISPKLGNVSTLYINKEGPVTIAYSVIAQPYEASHKESAATKLDIITDNNQMQNSVDKLMIFNKHKYTKPISKNSNINKKTSQDMQSIGHNGKDDFLATGNQLSRNYNNIKTGTTETFIEQRERTTIDHEVEKNKSTITSHVNQTTYPLSSNSKTIKPDEFQLSIRVGVETTKDRLKFSLVSINQRPENISQLIKPKEKTSTILSDIPFRVNQITSTRFKNDHENNKLNKEALGRMKLTRRINKIKDIKDIIPPSTGFKETRLPKVIKAKQRQVTSSKNLITGTVTNGIDNNIIIEDENILPMGTSENPKKYLGDEKQMLHVIDVTDTTDLIKRKHKKIDIKPGSLINPLTLEVLRKVYQKHLYASNNNGTEKENISSKSNTLDTVQKETFTVNNNSEHSISQVDHSNDDTSTFMGHQVQTSKKERLYNVSHNQKPTYFITEMLTTHEKLIKEHQNMTDATNSVSYFQDNNNNHQEQNHTNTQKNISQYLKINDITSTLEISNVTLQTSSNLPDVIKDNNNIFTPIEDSSQPHIKWNPKNETRNNLLRQYKVSHKTNRTLFKRNTISPRTTELLRIKKKSYNKKNTLHPKKRNNLVNSLKYKHDIADLLRKLVKSKKIDVKNIKLTNKSNIIHNLLSKIRKPTIHINITHTKYKSTTIPINSSYEAFIDNRITEKYKTQIDKPTRKFISFNSYDVHTKHYSQYDDQHRDSNSRKENSNYTSINRRLANTSNLFSTAKLTTKSGRKSSPNSFWGIRLIKMSEVINSTYSYKFLNQSLKNVSHQIPPSTFNQIGIKDKITKLVTSKPIISSHISTLGATSETFNTIPPIQRRNINRLLTINSNPSKKMNISNKEKYENKTHYITINISIPYVKLHVKSTEKTDRDSKTNTEDYNNFLYPNQSTTKMISSQTPKSGEYITVRTVLPNNTSSSHEYLSLTPNLHILLPTTINQKLSTSKFLKTLPVIKKNTVSFPSSPTKIYTHIDQITASYDNNQHSSNIVFNNSANNISLNENPKHFTEKLTLSSSNMPDKSLNQRLKETDSKNTYTPVPNVQGYLIAPSISKYGIVNNKKGMITNAKNVLRHYNNIIGSTNTDSNYLKQMSNKNNHELTTEVLKMETNKFYTNEVNATRTSDAKKVSKSLSDNYFASLGLNITVTNTDRPLNQTQIVLSTKNSFSYEDIKVSVSEKNIVSTEMKISGNNTLLIGGNNNSITQVNNVTTDTRSPYETNYGNILNTTNTPNQKTVPRKYPLKDITSNHLHYKYNTASINRLVNSNIIKNYKHFNNRSLYKTEYKYENATNHYSSKSDLKLNTTLFSINSNKKTENILSTTKTHSDENKFLQSSPRESFVSTISDRQTDLIGNANTINGLKLNSYPKKLMINSLDAIILKDKNTYRGPEYNNKTIIGRSTVMKHYDSILNNVTKVEGTRGLNILTQSSLTTFTGKIKLPQFNNNNTNFSFFDKYSTRSILVTQKSKHLIRYSDSVTNSSRSLSPEDSTNTIQNSSINTTHKADNLDSSNYQKATSMTPQITTLNLPSIMDLSSFIITPAKSHVITKYTKLNNFEGNHKNVENISEKFKEIFLHKDLLIPNVSTHPQKSTFKTPFQITQTPDTNLTDSVAVTNKINPSDTHNQHSEKMSLNITEINSFDRINEITPKNFSLMHRKSDKASFNMINTDEIPEMISTNINEESHFKSNLPVYTLNIASKNPIISQIYILEPKNSKNIWSRHIRRKARYKSNITKIYQSTDENVVSFTNIVPSTKLDVGLNSTKQYLKNPNSISEFSMDFEITSVDPMLLQLNSNIPKPIKALLNSSIHKQDSLNESTTRDSQNITVPRDTRIPNFATDFKDKTKYTSQINTLVTSEKYKVTKVNSRNTRKIYYTLVSISPNDFMPRINKYRYLRIPSKTVTKTIKYNTYQPPIKEENESPKYKTKLNPRPNVSCAILKTMRHKFHTTAEFMEFLKTSNCSVDNLTIHLNIKNNRFTPLPFAVNQKRKINNQLPNIKHPNIKLTKRVFTRIGSKEMVQSFEKTRLFPKRLKTIIPKMQPSIVKRIIIGDSRRKEIISMNTQDFFSQHGLRTPSHIKTNNKQRLKNPFLVKPRVSVLRPQFNPLETPRQHFDKPKTFFLPPRNSEEIFPEVYEAPRHHQGLNWKQKIGVIREALKNFPIVPVPSPDKMTINNVLDNPLTQIKADWNAKILRDNTELSKKKIWGPSDFLPLTIAPILQKPVTPFGVQLTPRQFRRNFPLVTHTTKGELKPVTDWWLDDMYLKVRLPLPINSNPGMVFPRRHFAKMEEVADLGALFIDDILDYKEMLDRGELPLERATSREKGQPLCMEQFYRLLGVCRIPEVGKDRLELPPVKSGSEEQEELVVVACRNYFYPIPVKAADRGRLTPGEIQAQLLHAMVDAAGARSAPRVGLLTSMNRDQWAKAREHLIKDETNRTNLELISRALCILCLDEAGGDRADTDPETNAMLRAMHGAGTRHHSANRWFDKTVQLIISSDGTVGMCYEHSAAEGVAVVRLAERALARAEVADRPAPPPALLPAPQAMKWNIVPDVQRSIEQAARDLDRAISDLDFKIYTYRGYGREFMKSCRTSPDVYIQLAIQYAYYKMYGYLVTTYESASLRRFRVGRVDNIRSAHGAALAWAAAMCTADTSPLNDTTDEGQKKVSFNLYGEQKKLELFEEAARKQTSIMEANILGKGIDNHLLGLREMARETMGELPAVFCDNAYKQMFEFRMSTSQVATTTDGTFMGYGAVCPDGYGCCYNPKKDSIIFCISSFTSSSVTNTEAYRQSLEEALDSMKLMFQTRKPEN